MTDKSIAVPVILWRGELRAQGLLLRRRLVTAAQAVVGGVIFVVVVLRVHDWLTTGGPFHTLNIAVVTLALGMLFAANVTLLGERTGTLPWQLRRWASSLPISVAQTSRLIVVFSFLRSGLLTLTLLTAVAVGALTAAHSLTGVAEIVISAAVLPLLPVALGLQWARRRGASVSIAFTIVPIAIGFTATALPLPLASGWAESVLNLIALPGLLLAGRVDLAEAVVFFAAWTGLALVLMRPAALALKEGSVDRGFGSSIWRLSRIPSTPSANLLALDIAVHRVRLTDLVEIVFLGVVSCTVVALQSFARGSVFGEVAMTGAFSAAAATAALAGYVHTRTAIQMDPEAEAWVRTLPISLRALSIARHAACVVGALLAVIPVMALAVVKSWPPEQGAFVLALWAGSTAVALTGWFAAYLSIQGWRRQLAGYMLFGWYGVRVVAGAAVLAVWNRPVLIVGLFAADLVVGALGHWRGATAAARERGL